LRVINVFLNDFHRIRGDFQIPFSGSKLESEEGLFTLLDLHNFEVVPQKPSKTLFFNFSSTTFQKTPEHRELTQVYSTSTVSYQNHPSFETNPFITNRSSSKPSSVRPSSLHPILPALWLFCF
jgi:hypothetical protein